MLRHYLRQSTQPVMEDIIHFSNITNASTSDGVLLLRCLIHLVRMRANRIDEIKWDEIHSHLQFILIKTAIPVNWKSFAVKRTTMNILDTQCQFTISASGKRKDITISPGLSIHEASLLLDILLFCQCSVLRLLTVDSISPDTDTLVNKLQRTTTSRFKVEPLHDICKRKVREKLSTPIDYEALHTLEIPSILYLEILQADKLSYIMKKLKIHHSYNEQ